MSPIHSVKETTKIFTNLQPIERDQLQESVMVTVATTLTKHPGSRVESIKRSLKVNSSDQFTGESTAEHSSDQYTEDDEYEDREEEEEEEDGEEDEEEEDEEEEDEEEYEQHVDREDTSERDNVNVKCNCEICANHRVNCSPGNCECFGGKKVKQDKSTSSGKQSTGTQSAIAEYRPNVLQSPFNFGVEYMARSVAACEKEVQGQVIGESLPSWLDGALVRIGPAKWDLKGSQVPGDGTFTLNNWLDGCAMLTKYRILDGNVFMSSRFLQSHAYQKMMMHGKPVFTEFGTRAYPDPDKSFISRIVDSLSAPHLSDNNLSNVYQLGDSVYAACESSHLWQVDVDTLKCKCKVAVDDSLKLPIASSHPHHSPSEGVVYNFVCTFYTGMKYHLLRIPVKSFDDPLGQSLSCCSRSPEAISRASIRASFASSFKSAFSYTHSFFMTQKYIIFVEQPLLVNGGKLAKCKSKGKSITECLEWHPNTPVRFFLIDKKIGFVSKVKFTTDPFFFLHTINSYETTLAHDDPSQPRHYVVLDMVTYESPAVLEKYNIAKMRNNLWDESCQPRGQRFILPLDDLTLYPNGHNLIKLPSTECTAVKISDDQVVLKGEYLGPEGFELPRINYALCNGKPYRYVYGTGGFNKGFYANSVCKLDVTSKSPLIWRPESKTAFAGEAVFVPRPQAVDEDDGIVLSVVIEVDATSDNSHFLVILDAKTMREIARAQFHRSRVHTAPSIHGIFISKSAE